MVTYFHLIFIFCREINWSCSRNPLQQCRLLLSNEISWYKSTNESNLFIKRPKLVAIKLLAFMIITKFLILQLFSQGTFAQKCDSVNRNQLTQSCLICNQLFQKDFSAAQRITAACITLYRNQCWMSDQNNFQKSRPLEVNGHLFHFFALVE